MCVCVCVLVRACVHGFADMCAACSRPHAMRMLRLLSARVHWHVLRVILAGMSDEGSFISLLPTEVMLRICQYIAPDAFAIN